MLAAALERSGRPGADRSHRSLSERCYARALERQRPDGSFGYTTGDYGFLRDRRSYPRQQVMTLFHLLYPWRAGTGLIRRGQGWWLLRKHPSDNPPTPRVRGFLILRNRDRYVRHLRSFQFRNAASPLIAAALKRATDAMAHRGPDDEGFYLDGALGLGNRRLSIIDLPGGHQPIANEDETIWITFNGEIYNYRDLRPDLLARGHQFRTEQRYRSDLHLYEQYDLELS